MGIDGKNREDLIATARRHLGAIAPLSTGLEPRPADLRGIRAVLFDVYGTMLVSARGEVGSACQGGGAGAVVRALEEGGMTVCSEAAGTEGLALMDRCIREDHAVARGRGIPWPEVDIVDVWRRVVAALAADGVVAGEADEAAFRKIALVYECLTNPVWPMPGMVELLAGLAASDIPTGIVSNSQFYTPLILDALIEGGLRGAGVDAGLCSWSFECGRAKPDTALFRPVLDRLSRERGIPPAGVLYIGNDWRNDIETALSLGCRALLFAGDARSLKPPPGQAPTAGRDYGVVTGMSQVLTYLRA